MFKERMTDKYNHDGEHVSSASQVLKKPHVQIKADATITTFLYDCTDVIYIAKKTTFSFNNNFAPFSPVCFGISLIFHVINTKKRLLSLSLNAV